MSLIYKPWHYQDGMKNRVVSDPYVGLFADMGLGKTVCTATGVNELLFDTMEIDKPLIIAPKFVAENTWPDEIEKWEHLKHLRISLIAGTPAQRKAALTKTADVFIVSWDNIAWLVALYGTAFPFDMMVLDESSKVKNPDSQRFKALKQIAAKVKRIVLLSGTPTPNGLIDLWSQIYLLDKGQRLGDTITKYRNTYFNEGQKKGFVVYNYKLKKESETLIHEKIADICVSLKTEDYLELPERIDTIINIKMDAYTIVKYQQFERELVLEFENEEQITAANAAVLTGKLLQFANGAVYNADRTYRELHQAKIEALIDRVETANGEPVLVFYQFQHDLARILKYLKAYKPIVLKGKEQVTDWNNGKIMVMLAHAASAGHGLNLQYGGHRIVWFGCPWSLELYEQAVHRIDRQGQQHIVFNDRLIVESTLEHDVLLALSNKRDTQNAMLEAVKARFEKYKNSE